MSDNKNVKVEGNTASVHYVIEPDACDMMAAWRPGAILTVMQTATRYGREAMGIGWAELAEKGALWVVSRVSVKLDRIPKLGETLTVQAAALTPVKLLFPWKFRFTDEAGETVGEAGSIWNLMDAGSRRISFIPGIGEKIPRPEGGISRMELPAMAEEIPCSPQRKAVRPVFTDLDINGHVSHIRYADWCCNAMGPELLRHFAVDSFRITYMQEVRPEAVIDTELRLMDSRFSFSGYNAESPAFILDGTLAKR